MLRIERELRSACDSPLMHDDQHGTAIIFAAALLNGLKVLGKDFRDVKVACRGGGAAALGCLDLLVSLGVSRENIMVTDRDGAEERRAEEMNPYFALGASDANAPVGEASPMRTLLGLSAPGVVTPDMSRPWRRVRSFRARQPET